MHVLLPDDQWADLRSPKQVPERYRRPILPLVTGLIRSAGFAQAGDSDRRPTTDEMRELAKAVGPDDLKALNDLNDATIIAMVEKWSFSQPVAADSLLDLPGDAYDSLREITAPFLLELIPDFGPTPAADSPTPPSAV